MSLLSARSAGQKPAELVPFDQVTERGLKPLLKPLAKAGHEVAKVEATNRAKRLDGQLVKIAKLTMVKGQVLTLAIGAGGDLYQVKLGTTVVPIGEVKKLSQVAKELAQALERNQRKFDQAQQRKAAKMKQPAEKKPTPSRSVGARLKAAQANLAGVNDEIAELETNLTETRAHNDELRADIQSSETSLNGLRATTQVLNAEWGELTEQLEQLEASA